MVMRRPPASVVTQCDFALDRIDKSGQLGLLANVTDPQVNRLLGPFQGIVVWQENRGPQHLSKHIEPVHRVGREEYGIVRSISAGRSGNRDPTLSAREPDQNRAGVASHSLHAPASAKSQPLKTFDPKLRDRMCNRSSDPLHRRPA